MMDEGGTTILVVTNAAIQFMSGPLRVTLLIATLSISMALVWSGVSIPNLGPEVVAAVTDTLSVISDTASFTGSISSDSDIVEPIPTTAELLTNLLTTLRAQTNYLTPGFNHVINSMENSMFEIQAHGLRWGQNAREIFLLHENFVNIQNDLRYLARNLYALINQSYRVTLVQELYPLMGDIRNSAQFLVDHINNVFNRTTHITAWLYAIVNALRRG